MSQREQLAQYFSFFVQAGSAGYAIFFISGMTLLLVLLPAELRALGEIPNLSRNTGGFPGYSNDGAAYF